MATVKAFIRVYKKNKNEGKVNIRFRLSDGRDVQLFHVSNIEVNPQHWDSSKEAIKSKILFREEERILFNKTVSDRKNTILKAYKIIMHSEEISSKTLDQEIEKLLYPEKYWKLENQSFTPSFFKLFDDFLRQNKLSQMRRRHYMVVRRALQRFELYMQITSNSFELNFDIITDHTLRDLENFLQNEYNIFNQYPQIYEAIPETRNPQKRGLNTISGILKKIRTFLLWANTNGKTMNNPFKTFKINEEIYGTPIYISIDERNQLYQANLSSRPALAIQRDIFVFQCLIGCRIGDLCKLTKANVINGAIEYIPRKTKDGRPVTVRVPLNSVAKEILNRYSNTENNMLLPFISEPKYNDAIKEAFQTAGLTRMVTVLDPTTRQETKKPLNEIASSHMARRTFVGNLYKQVKDPNLVGSLSGHKEGSRAFTRYREIDEEMKNELVKMLE